MSEQLDRLAERVGNGITWLTEHDPTGAYHLWFTGRILPSSPKPGSTPEMAEGYRAYYPARVAFEQLFSAMEREEQKEARAP